ncbi:hypothetical protein E4T66_18495 [Sinimarinibacterium sp. CAU 1509]|uniref:hypothetical protein n=1 Tax=Sinimarinibacterium sp. CAU 1509 TaxID=2562283 RepID=UPI0010ACDD21|nr:hypothetical protein [Sinimarinibacterium sp. CAU 1509]TJY57397.1 hypothetical protein E4T66_18495 [Sinimarinibacterium sp. CAU 1509]
MHVLEHHSALVTSILEHAGWTVRAGATFATKHFATVVGDKAASLLMLGTRSVRGDFSSEGLNVLGGRPLLLPEDANAQQVAEQVAGFLTEAEALIVDSWTVRVGPLGGR